MVIVKFDKPVKHIKGFKDHYYMSDVLKPNLDIIKKAVTKDWDFLFVVDGIERCGKSVLAQQLAYYLDKTLDLSRIVFSGEEFKKACLKAKPHEVIIWDEAITGANIRQTMDRMNIGIMRMLGMIGQKNLFIIVVLPTFYDLDRYIALWRSRGVFHIYAKGYDDRGYFQVYKANKDIMFTNWRLRKSFRYPPKYADFNGRFGNTYCVNEQEYRDKKATALTFIDNKEKDKKTNEQRDILIYDDYTNKFRKVTEIAKLVKLHKQTIYDIINRMEENIK